VALAAFSWVLLSDGVYSRSDAFWQLAAFSVLLPAYCWLDQRGRGKGASPQPAGETAAAGSRGMAWKHLFKLAVGLAVLVGSSHFLVWGAVDTARMLGVSELLIGLTVLAFGTSLPELASAVASARKGKHEFVLGNIVGSNLFNTLAVVGIAGALEPIKEFSPYVLWRDLPVMIAATLSVSLFGLNWAKPGRFGRITRLEGALWAVAFVVYTVLTIYQEV
jgi:cation:H+ antiporter